MARKYDITNIVDPVKAPFTKRSLTHLNTAFDDLTRQLIESSFTVSYTTNDIVIIEGCKVTANIPGTSSVTAGKIYYNGRIYDVDANASISSPSDTLYWQIATTYITGDPATFSDGNSYNFHVIEKFELVNGTSGGGLGDYDAATIKYKIRKFKYNIGSWDMDANNSVQISTGLNYVDYGDKIYRCSIIIYDDTLAYAPIINNVGATNAWFRPVNAGGGLTIEINRLTGGTFDNPSYDDTLIDRGYFIIETGDI